MNVDNKMNYKKLYIEKKLNRYVNEAIVPPCLKSCNRVGTW